MTTVLSDPGRCRCASAECDVYGEEVIQGSSGSYCVSETAMAEETLPAGAHVELCTVGCGVAVRCVREPLW